MIKANAVGTAIIKQRRKSRVVFRIMHISVTIHLKPVNKLLFRQTNYLFPGRKNHHTLLQLVETQLHIVINHTMIADAAFIHICIAFIIRHVVPQRFLVLRFNGPNIQAGKIRSRLKILLSSDMLYRCHHTGKCQRIPIYVFISACIHLPALIRKYPAELIDADFDRFNHELRTVIALQQADMQFGVFLRQEEGFFNFSIVEIGKIDAAVVVVVTTAGKHNPMSVARP